MPTIAPNDPNIIYPRGVWDVTADRARTLYNGAYLRTMIDGCTTIALTFDLTGLSGVLPIGAYRVDNGPWTRFSVAASVALTMPTTNTWTRHTLEVVYETKKQFSSTGTPNEWGGASDFKLTGIVIDAGQTLPIQRKPADGIVFGDSIMRGVLTLSNTVNADSRDNSARLGIGWLMTQHLNAEVGVAAIGATGWADANASGEPTFETWSTLMWEGGPTRDLTGLKWIAIAHGENDPIAGNMVATVTAAVTATLNKILAAADAATKIIVFRPLSGKVAAPIQAGIAACSAPTRVTYVDTNGWYDSGSGSTDDDVHPHGNWTRFQLAPRYAAAIEAATNTPTPAAGTRFIKTATGLVAI